MEDILAFNTWHVCRLTGLSPRQLAYWDRTGFFSPSLGEGTARSYFARVYSFRDVVGLRVLAVMRNKHRIPLQRLRQVGAYLAERYREPWSTLSFYIAGQQVFYQGHYDEAVRRADRSGQTVIDFAVEAVADDVRALAAAMRNRAADQVGRVMRHRLIAENQSVLAGTRIPTRAVWEFHQAGYEDDAILREYPSLTLEDVRAALEFECKRANRAS